MFRPRPGREVSVRLAGAGAPLARMAGLAGHPAEKLLVAVADPLPVITLRGDR